MVDTLPASEFLRQTHLPDWRVLLNRLEATFTARSYAAAAAFVGDVAVLADELGHHPAVDLRPPGTVHVAVSSSSQRRFTTADAHLAERISAVAQQSGLTSTATASQAFELAIDALDIDLVRPFWAAVLGYEEEPTAPGEQVDAILDPARIGPAVWFQQMDAARPQRNRIHVDVAVPHDVAEARVAAALAAGGRLLTDRYAKAFWVLADPEGNEACVCTWQDRD